MKRAIFWFRRDLRLTDNRGLYEASQAAEEVIPIYVVSVWRGGHRWTGPARQRFLCGSLDALSKSLDAIGGRLIFQEGQADEVLEELLEKTHAEAIYYNRDPDPFGRAMEAKVERMALRQGAKVFACQDVALHERDEVLTGNGTPFKVFTPYAKAWAKLKKPAPLPAISRLKTPVVRSIGVPTLEQWGVENDAVILPPGEQAARKRLETFLARPILRYAAVRDIPGEEGTSRLSQDLRFGLLSIREVYAKCLERLQVGDAIERKSVQTYVNELIWREFYLQILWHVPSVLQWEFNPKYRGLPWANPKTDRKPERWMRGETGFPIVDAAMRQMDDTGFMHNRLRMITAMFLTKDLHLDWREGEMFFMQKLVDGEIASNNGGWQWSAGTGADAAPYFRVQNPWLQSKRFDPEGAFIKKWLPELRDVPAAKLHQPPASSKLAKNYFLPIVDHSVERDRAIEIFKTAAGK